MEVLKFFTHTCVSCKRVEILLGNYSNPVTSIDCTIHPEIASQYRIMTVPVVVIKDDQTVIARLVGDQITKESLDKFIS